MIENAQARDAAGHGRRRWPHGARLAVWVVPNVEMFDESVGIDGSAPGETQPLMLREYGNRVGVERLRRLFAKYDVRVTAAVNARIADANPGLLRDVVEDGWELMGHGVVNNRRLTSYPREQEAEVIAGCLDKLTAASGRRPVGWLSPGMSETPHTLAHLVANGIEYTGDLTDRDVPYSLDVTGGRITAVPYGVEANDRPAYDRRYMSPDQFADQAIRQFDFQYQEAADTAQVFCLGLHPYLSGVPHRMAATERILRHLRDHDEVWFATGSEILAAHRDHESQAQLS